MSRVIHRAGLAAITAIALLVDVPTALAQRGGGGRPGGGMPAGGGRPGGGMPAGGGRPAGGMPSGGSRPVGGMPTGGGSRPPGGMPPGNGMKPPPNYHGGSGYRPGYGHGYNNGYYRGYPYYGSGIGFALGLGFYGGSPYYYGTNTLSYYYDSTPVVVSGPASQYYPLETNPDYSTPPPPPKAQPVDVGEARISVIVPTPDAKIWFNDTPTTTQGKQREYRTSGLDPSKTYTYTIRAEWLDNGRAMTQTRVVPIQAGQMSVANFGQPELLTVPPTNP